MKKYILILFMIILIAKNLNALITDEIDYKITDYITEATLDTRGNMKIKEVIKVEGTFNSYTRDIFYRDRTSPKFTGAIEDFIKSDIYNASNITIYKVGTINYTGNLNYDVFDREVNVSEECLNNKKCYRKTNITDGLSIKMFNETISSTTYFYLEYLIGNTVVMHEDTAEVYYTFISENFMDDIEKYKLRLILPNTTQESLRIWTHHPLASTSLIKDESNKLNYGGYLEINDLKSNTPVDLRLLFSTYLIDNDNFFLKRTNVEAIPKILIVEETKNIKNDNIKETPNKDLQVVQIISLIYIILTLTIMIYIHIKYDREFKTRFKRKYYTEIIDEYPITHIEYLFKKNITELSFSTSIINLIYKNNISYNPQTHKLTLNKVEGLSESDLQILEILFNKVGNGISTSIEEIKESSILNKEYEIWKRQLINECIKDKFFIDNSNIKLMFSLYSLLGIMVIFIHKSIMIFDLSTLLVCIITGIYILYIIFFTKRTKKGANHYAKWKSFKRYLKDKKISQKEEVYYMYANILGLSKIIKDDNIILINNTITNAIKGGKKYDRNTK